jgi:hypothetical protein
MPLGAIGGAILGGALVGTAGSLIASNQQAGAQKQAASTQANELSSIQQLENPYVQAGYGATSTLNELLGTAPTTGSGGTAGTTGLPGGYLTQQFNPTQAQLNSYPGYQFQLQTGGQAIRNADTPGVGALSGAALKDLTSFNQGLAGTNYQNYFNQFQTQQNNIFSRLSGIAQLGQASAGGVASAGTQLGQGVAQAQAGAGASYAGGTVGAANAAGNSGLNYLLLNSALGGSSGGFNPAATPGITGGESTAVDSSTGLNYLTGG